MYSLYIENSIVKNYIKKAPKIELDTLMLSDSDTLIRSSCLVLACLAIMNVSQKALFTLRTLALTIFSLPSVRPFLSLSSRLLFSTPGLFFVSLVVCINKAQTKSLDKATSNTKEMQ